MNVFDFQQFIKLNFLKKIEVAEYLGVSPSYISKVLNGEPISPDKLRKLLEHPSWDTSMLSGERHNTGNTVNTGDINGDHNTVTGGDVVNGVPAANIPSWLPTTSDSDTEVIEAEEVPFISKPIIESRETDIRSYIERGDAKTIIPQGLIQGGASYARKIYSDAMAPDIREGDIVLCTFVPDTSNLVDGDIYAVDTTKYGCVIRDIYHDGTGIILRARNHKFPELRVEQNEITSVAIPMQLIRSTFSQRTDYAKIIRDKDERIDLLVTREFDHIRHSDRLLEQLDKASARQDKLIEMLEKK